MKTLSVGEFKAQFSSVIEWVKAGEEIAVTYGKKKEVIGHFHPESSKKLSKRKLGIYNNMKGYKMADNFNETSYEEFLISNT